MFAKFFSQSLDTERRRHFSVADETQTVSGPSRDKMNEVAPLIHFADWLRQAGETEALSRHHLRLLYGEFCLDTETAELTPGQLHRRIREAGILRYREPVGKRRWFYRVRSEALQRSAIAYAAEAA